MKVNLGSGKDILNGYENYDMYVTGDGIKYVDLNKELPFKDNSVDEVFLGMVLEHIDEQYKFLMSVDKVLKKGGKLRIVLPYWTHTVEHITQCHNPTYLHPLYSSGEKNNNEGEYRLNSYEIVKIKRIGFFSLQMFRNILRRILIFFEGVFFTEFEIELVKKKKN